MSLGTRAMHGEPGYEGNSGEPGYEGNGEPGYEGNGEQTNKKCADQYP